MDKRKAKPWGWLEVADGNARGVRSGLGQERETRCTINSLGWGDEN